MFTIRLRLSGCVPIRQSPTLSWDPFVLPPPRNGPHSFRCSIQSTAFDVDPRVAAAIRSGSKPPILLIGGPKECRISCKRGCREYWVSRSNGTENSLKDSGDLLCDQCQRARLTKGLFRKKEARLNQREAQLTTRDMLLASSRYRICRHPSLESHEPPQACFRVTRQGSIRELVEPPSA
jgi:hypothetical protein